MATEMYIKHIASDNAFPEIFLHIHHHSKVTTADSLQSSILSSSGFIENGLLKIK
jgi:hypothetical protein